jgi:hypothetical protein
MQARRCDLKGGAPARDCPDRAHDSATTSNPYHPNARRNEGHKSHNQGHFV